MTTASDTHDPSTDDAAPRYRSADREALIDELRIVARTGASGDNKESGTISGGIAEDNGDDGHPTLVKRDGMISAYDALRSDYWIGSASANLPALVGVGGGAWIGLSIHGAVGLAIVLWGLVSAATGRLLIGKSMREQIFLGTTARLLGLLIAGAGVSAGSAAETRSWSGRSRCPIQRRRRPHPPAR